MANEQDVMMNGFPEANDGRYFYLESEDGKQIRVTSASAAKMISSAIKNDPNLLANVNFGAKTSTELASVVAEQLGKPIGFYPNIDPSSIDSVRTSGMYCFTNSSGIPTLGWTAYGLLFVITNNSRTTQIFMHYQGNIAYRSYTGEWDGWRKIETSAL